MTDIHDDKKDSCDVCSIGGTEYTIVPVVGSFVSSEEEEYLSSDDSDDSDGDYSSSDDSDASVVVGLVDDPPRHGARAYINKSPAVFLNAMKQTDQLVCEFVEVTDGHAVDHVVKLHVHWLEHSFTIVAQHHAYKRAKADVVAAFYRIARSFVLGGSIPYKALDHLCLYYIIARIPRAMLLFHADASI